MSKLTRRALMMLTWLCAVFSFSFSSVLAAHLSDTTLPLEQAPIATSTQGDVTVTVTWVYADATRITVEYLVAGLTPPAGYAWAGCIVRSATLTDGSARQFGKNGVGLQCDQRESGDFHVTQTFYQDLSASKTGNLPLQFTVYVGGNEIFRMATEGEENDEIKAEFAPDAGVFTFDLPTPLSKGLTLRPRLKDQRNGVVATLREVQINPTFLESDICLTLPSTADWQPEAALTTAQGRQTNAGWEIINFKQSKAWASRQRCYRFTFATALDVGAAQTLQIEIERLVIGLPEVLTEEACFTAKQKRNEMASAVDFECLPVESGYWFEITQTPEGMTADEAYRQVTRLFSEVVEGPWVFSIETQANNR